VQGVLKAEVVERGGPELAREPADLVEVQASEFVHCNEPDDEVVRRVVDHAAELQQQCGHSLSDFVVELGGESASLLFLAAHDTGAARSAFRCESLEHLIEGARHGLELGGAGRLQALRRHQQVDPAHHPGQFVERAQAHAQQ
jgi:hypothetical protein